MRACSCCPEKRGELCLLERAYGIDHHQAVEVVELVLAQLRRRGSSRRLSIWFEPGGVRSIWLVSSATKLSFGHLGNFGSALLGKITRR